MSAKKNPNKKSKIKTTKKVKNRKINKKALWKQFDDEFNTEENLECVYSKQKVENRERCEVCDSLYK